MSSAGKRERRRRTLSVWFGWCGHGRRSNRRLCEWVPQAERVCAKRWQTSTFQHRFLSSTQHSQSRSVFTLSIFFVFNLCEIIVLHHLWVTRCLDLNFRACEYEADVYQSLKLDINNQSIHPITFIICIDRYRHVVYSMYKVTSPRIESLNHLKSSILTA